MWAICKKEWKHYFNSLTGYLIIGFYLMVNGLFLFILPNYNVLDFGYASLQVYFDLAPWFLLLLVPAITMRCFSDEYKQGTYEILKSLPVSSMAMVLAKFLGAYLIVVASILPTVFYAIAMDALSAVGGLDWGATLGAYIGLFLLAAVYTSIGVLLSAITKNNLVALFGSIVFSALMLKGFDWVSMFSFLNNGMKYYLTQLGLSTHYYNISKGVIELRDVVYFLSLVVLFLSGAIERIAGKVKYVYIIIILLIANYGIAFFSLQLDLTKEHRYTLSTRSEEIIRQLPGPVKVHLYLGGDLPPYYRKIANSTEVLLNKLHQLNPINVEWTLEVPNEMYKDTALYEFYDSLASLGVPIERLHNQNEVTDKRVDQLIMPGAIVEVPGQPPYVIDLRSSKKYFKPYNIVKDIPMEDVEASANAAESLLEHKFIQAIYQLHRTQIPSIAYLIGNGQPIDFTVNDLGELLKNQYHLTVFDLKKGYPDPNKIKTLLIVKPTKAFSEIDKLKLDQYVINGGNIIWAIDKLHAEYDSLQKTNGEYVAFDRGLGLDDLLFKYGVRINGNLVQDLNCARLPLVVGTQSDGTPLIQRMPWPYYPFLSGNENQPISKNIDRILSLFPSSIDTIFTTGIQKTILLSTDTNSRALSTPALVTLNSVKDEMEMRSLNKHHLPIAVLLEGKFKSLFAHRISASEKDSVAKGLGKPFQDNGSHPSKQIIIADADILLNSVGRKEDGSPNPLPMGMLPFEEYQFGNRSFFLNVIEYFNEPVGLMESRNKQIVLRLLDQEKVKENRLFWQIILVLGPLLILILWAMVWDRHRKVRFAN